MPTSECNQISLQQQYHNLRRDWEDYKTSIPFHRRSRSTADLPSSASDVDSEFFQISCNNLVSSPQFVSQSQRMRLLQDLEKVKQAKATEIECPLCCRNFTSSSSSLAWHENEYEDSSSDNDDEGLEEKDSSRGEKEEWIKRLRWFFILIGAVGVGVCSFATLSGLDDVGQLMTPT